MAMDCAFNNITFICTKTDDASVKEVSESLGLDLSHLYEQGRSYDQRLEVLQEELGPLHKRKDNLNDRMNDLDDRLDEFGECLSNPPPYTSPMKRKREGGSGQEVTRQADPTLATGSKDNQSWDGDDGASAISDSLQEIQTLRAQRKALYSERRILNIEIRQKQKELDSILIARSRI